MTDATHGYRAALRLFSAFSLILTVAAVTVIHASGQAPQAGEWAWLGGSSTVGNNGGQPGVYGTLGIANANNIPGGRAYAARWLDGSGNLWLFGGGGIDVHGNCGYLNDLWELNLSTNEWTWMGGGSTVPITTICSGRQPGVYGSLGTPAAGNVPGGREDAATWTDSNGNLWLFGGEATNATGNPFALNDLWEFSPSTNSWTWRGGSNTIGSNSGQPGIYGALGTPGVGNIPGARGGATYWTDSSGNFWLFGGGGYDSTNTEGLLNDLWEFNPSTAEWTWISGSSTVGVNGGQPGIYGTLGVPAVGNIPGGRSDASEWLDKSGNVWLFGGFVGYGNLGTRNDLWKFTPNTKEWTWMGGSNTALTCGGPYNIYCGQLGVYGTLGTPASGNIPTGRLYAANWTDSSGNFWLFGGLSYHPTEIGELNDLWEFNPSTSLWTWMGGSSTFGVQPGLYGTLGTPANTNFPGARVGATSWTDSGGSFWLFGGNGYDSESVPGALNDLWKGQTATISGLTVQLQNLNLPFGTANSLLAKLQAAEAAGSGSAACSDLNDFVAEVHAQSGKKLTVAQANQLIATATQLEIVQGCN